MNDQVTREETSEILRLAEQSLAAEGDFVELGCYRGDTSVLLGQLLQKYSQTHLHQNSSATPDSNPDPNLNTHSKLLWIYDSFAGLPEKTSEDSSGAGANFQKGELLVTKRKVIDKLRKHGLKTSSHLPANPTNLDRSSHPSTNQASPNPTDLSYTTVIVKKAWFDDLQPQDLPNKIAFAFCDGDLYGSIKTSLQLVHPRLAKQGIIIVHDYNNPELPGSARAVDEFLRTHPEYHLQVRHTLAILQLSSVRH